MVKRRTKLAVAALAALGGLLAGSRLYLRYQAEREGYLGVTLFSEPHYRGRRRTLTCADGGCALAETSLRRVGSVRVERLSAAMRPAAVDAGLVWGWVRSAVLSGLARDVDGAVVGGRNAVGLLAGVFAPGAWRVERDPAGDRQSWVRLWAEGSAQASWLDVVADTPDLGSWAGRVSFVEVGVRSVQGEAAVDGQ